MKIYEKFLELIGIKCVKLKYKHTRFNMGDKVYYMSDNKILSSEIIGISIGETPSIYRGEGELYYFKNGDSRFVEYCFSNKESVIYNLVNEK